MRHLLATFAGLVLAGCSTFGVLQLQPGKSTEADVRRAMGEPAKTYTLPDGTRQHVYPMGPGGMQTYMAYVSPSGSLVRMEQVLADAQFRQIVPGKTTAEEVERLIGPPWRKVDFPNKRQVAWDYVYRDTWDYTVDLAVMIDERGIVAETVHARQHRGDPGHH